MFHYTMLYWGKHIVVINDCHIIHIGFGVFKKSTVEVYPDNKMRTGADLVILIQLSPVINQLYSLNALIY